MWYYEVREIIVILSEIIVCYTYFLVKKDLQ